MPSQNIDFISVGDLADELGVQSWRIARIFELGLVPEPARLSRRRIIPRTAVPAIIEALRRRHWLPENGGRK